MRHVGRMGYKRKFKYVKLVQLLRKLQGWWQLEDVEDRKIRWEDVNWIELAHTEISDSSNAVNFVNNNHIILGTSLVKKGYLFKKIIR